MVSPIGRSNSSVDEKSSDEKGRSTGVEVSVTQIDTAAALVDGNAEPEVSEQVALAVRRKIDWHILPLMATLYWIQYMDKATLGSAAILGIREDAHLTTDQYNWLGTVFYLSYLAFEFPQNLALQRFPVAKWLRSVIFRLMPSNRNHHDQAGPAGSPPRAAGSVHPRPQDESSNESSGSQEDVFVTRSPSTRRPIQKRRGNATEGQHLAQQMAAPAIVPLAYQALHVPTLPTPPAATVSHEDPLAPHLAHLESLLDSALATVAILADCATTRPQYSAHTQEALRVLLKHIALPTTIVSAPPAAAATIAPTYAEATSASRKRPDKRGPAPTRPSNHVTKSDSQPVSRPTRSTPSPYRLTLRFTIPPEPEERASPDLLTQNLCMLTSTLDFRDRVAGVNWTHNGNLVIHTRAPYTALQLRDTFVGDDRLACTVGAACRPGSLGENPFGGELELDTPWTRVVLHGVPAGDVNRYLDGSSALWDALDRTGVCRQEVKAIRVLCPEEELTERDSFALSLTIGDTGLAQRMLSSGVFLFGTHCGVSRYRPRSKTTHPES
ncbi:hypothetical protein C8R43DRAFT_1121175 [Mycena crocata]|nr:hypothetical protein C8R43DRAFT_1121175 [Mycena crocata]